MTIRVFLLDDHELVREGLRAILEREHDMRVVGEAASALEGRQGICAVQPDVALIDRLLPDGDGLDLCGEITAKLPEVACLILTPQNNDDVLLSAIRADAAGFLLKRTSAAEIVRSIRRVASGESLIDPGLSGRLLERLRTGRVEDHQVPALDHLSPQERRLLFHLGDGLSNRQVAERMDLAEKTVKNYVSNLLRKLGMTSRTEAAVFVAGLQAQRAQSGPGDFGPGDLA